MTDGFAAVMLWAAALGCIALVSKGVMQMIWLALVGAVLAAPVLAAIFPALR